MPVAAEKFLFGTIKQILRLTDRAIDLSFVLWGSGHAAIHFALSSLQEAADRKLVCRYFCFHNRTPTNRYRFSQQAYSPSLGQSQLRESKCSGKSIHIAKRVRKQCRLHTTSRPNSNHLSFK